MPKSRYRFTLAIISLFSVALVVAACTPGIETPVVATPASTNVTPTLLLPTVTPATPVGFGTDIRIGLMGPFTGADASLGTVLKRGAELAVKEINTSGGINGRKVALIERDDKSSPAEGIVILKDLIEKEKVLALFGTASATVAISQAPLVQQARVPWIIPLASSTRVSEETTPLSFIFRIGMLERDQATILADFIALRYKRLVLIHDEGLTMRDELLKALSAKSIVPVTTITYKAGATPEEIKPLLTPIKNTLPDAIIVTGLAADAVTIRRGLKEQLLELPMLGFWGLSLGSFGAGAGELANGVLFPQTFTADATGQRQIEFINRYKAEYRTEQISFPSGLAQSYDGMRLLLEAIKNNGAVDSREKLREALEGGLVYDGILKKYEKPFANPNHEALTVRDIYMATWQNEKIVRFK